eukprot:COSAG04_NODE_6613_length_1292_cov_1.658843_3_plen_99_part_01
MIGAAEAAQCLTRLQSNRECEWSFLEFAVTLIRPASKELFIGCLLQARLAFFFGLSFCCRTFRMNRSHISNDSSLPQPPSEILFHVQQNAVVALRRDAG